MSLRRRYLVVSFMLTAVARRCTIPGPDLVIALLDRTLDDRAGIGRNRIRGIGCLHGVAYARALQRSTSVSRLMQLHPSLHGVAGRA